MLIEGKDLIRELDRIGKMTDEQKVVIKTAKMLVESAEPVEAIPVDWLHKELVDLVFNDEISSDQMKVFHKLIAKWRETCA